MYDETDFISVVICLASSDQSICVRQHTDIRSGYTFPSLLLPASSFHRDDHVVLAPKIDLFIESVIIRSKISLISTRRSNYPSFTDWKDECSSLFVDQLSILQTQIWQIIRSTLQCHAPVFVYIVFKNVDVFPQRSDVEVERLPITNFQSSVSLFEREISITAIVQTTHQCQRLHL